ncbi:MAG: N-formylglutamate deformylase [Steroidobacteraceae bacterium]
MSAVEVTPGDGPVLLAMPHSGVEVPSALWERLNERGRALADTDWHVDRLYLPLLPGATRVRARFHRYVIDANRSPDGASLYPGQNSTALCPLTDFAGEPIYREGTEPDAADIAARLREFHSCYHEALQREITRIKERFGCVVLYDCHSIRSVLPFLFDGELAIFNIGSNGGRSCAPDVVAGMADICRTATGYSHVVDGRFRGGWTTRHYGQPAAGVHAVQMELAQRCYMDATPPWRWREERASAVQRVLGEILLALDELARGGRLEMRT